MWPLDVKRMNKIFGSISEIDGMNPGPDLILSKDIDLEISGKNNEIKIEAGDENEVLTINDVMDRMFGSNNRARPLPEMFKVMRNWLQEKRQFDADDQKSLQESIDCIQKCIDIDSQPVMIDRLSSISRQLKLKSSFRSGCFIIESQFFTVDIKLEPGTGRPFECTVQHYEASKNSCPSLVEILRKKQFDEFTRHIEQITYLYSIGTDKVSKLKIFTAFDCLERDILMLESISKASINDCNNLVHMSPVGVVEPRQGGTPMKLIYFVRPDELFDKKLKSTLPFTVDTVIKRQLGHHVKVEIEPNDVPIKLQQRPLCDLKDKIDAKRSLPEFAFHNSSNSTPLHACFVLKLSKPVVLSQELAKQISSLTNQQLSDNHEDILKLFTSQNSSQIQCNTNSYRQTELGTKCFVETKDYLQKYFVNEYSESTLMGILIDSIRFNHPAQVSKILTLLRQQLLFNAFIESVLKPFTTGVMGKNIANNSTKPVKMIELSFDDLRSIHIKFTHPLSHQEITLIIILDGKWSHSGIRCKLFPENLHDNLTEDKVLKVLQKTSSIPDCVSFIIHRIVDSNRRSKENDVSSTTPILKTSTNTMLMNMLQDTGHAGKKRNLPEAISNNDNTLSNDGKEKKRRRTESSDSKASNSSQERESSISLLLSTSVNNQSIQTTTTNSSSLSATVTPSASSSAAAAAASSVSLSAALSSSSPSLSLSLSGGVTSTSVSGNDHPKSLNKSKSISLLQPQDSGLLKPKIQVTKNPYLKNTSRQNSQEASSPNASGSGMPENLAEILSRVTTGLPKTGLIGKDSSGSLNKKLQDSNQIRRNTLSATFERAVQQKGLSNSGTIGSIITSGEKSTDDRNAFTIKHSNSSSLKMSLTKNKNFAGSVNVSNLTSSNSGNITTGNSSSTTGNGNSINSNNGSIAAESGPAADLLAKIQKNGSSISSLFNNKTGKYTIPKIPKIQQQTQQSGTIVNALTDLVDKKQPMQFSQRPLLAQTIPRNNLSPMRQNSQPSPQIQRSPQTSNQIIFQKQAYVSRFPTASKQVKLNSIVNALHQRQNSAPLGEETGLFKPLSQQSQQNQQSNNISSLSNSLSDHNKSVSSSTDQDVKPLSTPSSPVESPSAILLEQSMQNVPVIIPVDAIEPKNNETSTSVESISGSNSNDKI